MAATQWTRCALAVPTLALALAGLRSPATRFPVGTYDSDAYTLTFDAKGAFRYVKGDQLMVQGKYVLHDSTIALTDEKGIDACVGADRNPGTYRWQQVQKALWFRTIRDQCPDRIRGLADQAWQPHRARGRAAADGWLNDYFPDLRDGPSPARPHLASLGLTAEAQVGR